jgi:hypothetical protein
MNVLREEMHSTSKIREWQVLPYMVNQVSERAVCQGTQGLMRGPTLSQQHILIKQSLHIWNKLCKETKSCKFKAMHGGTGSHGKACPQAADGDRSICHCNLFAYFCAVYQFFQYPKLHSVK